jgi:hypothetical protein
VDEREARAARDPFSRLESQWTPSPVGRAQSQEQLPTFRSSANAVMVDVNVRDKNRKVISNLKASDFEGARQRRGADRGQRQLRQVAD